MNASTLLVVDDEADICELIKDVAEAQGVETQTASTHEDFKRLYWSYRPALIFLDLQMPDADGIELLRFLAADGCHAEIVLVSGMDSRVLAAAKRLGASQGLRMGGIVEKPIDIERVEQVLVRATRPKETVTPAELKNAIEQGQLVVHYQPKARFEAAGGVWRVDEAEALVRWQDPKRGIVPPGLFIPVAEESGLIVPLTEFVVRQVAGQLGAWDAAGIGVSVAVNLAPQLLTRLQFPDFLAAALAEHAIDHERLTVEITETAAMSTASRVFDVLTRLRVKNFGLSIDDFGTAHSSLVRVHRAPFSELKVDKSFVLDLDENEESEIIVRAIVNLAHNLGLEVCAEGVEREAVAERLHAFGCDKFQGYLLSKPVPAAEFARLARAQGWAALKA